MIFLLLKIIYEMELIISYYFIFMEFMNEILSKEGIMY